MNWVIGNILDYILTYFEFLWESLVFWRGVSLMLLTTLILIFKYQKMIFNFLHPDDSNEHDKEIFDKLNSSLTESSLDTILNNASNYRNITRDHVIQLNNYLYLSSKNEIKFLNKKLQPLFEEHLSSLSEFKDFTSTHFFSKNNDKTLENFWLYPDLKEKGLDGNVYHDRTRELIQLCKQVEVDYNRYRSHIKTELKT